MAWIRGRTSKVEHLSFLHESVRFMRIWTGRQSHTHSSFSFSPFFVTDGDGGTHSDEIEPGTDGDHLGALSARPLLVLDMASLVGAHASLLDCAAFDKSLR
jgi:hypothetical protein